MPPTPFTADKAVPVMLPELNRQEPATRDRIGTLHAKALTALEQEPLEPTKVAKAYGELGAHLAAIGLFEGAADCFENARRADPTAFRWHYYLAIARQEDSKLEPAVAAYAEALQLRPDDLPSRLHRVDALIELDRIDEAASELEILRRGSPTNSDHAAVQFALAQVAAAQGRFVDAIEGFERTLELQPSADAAHYPLSQAYLRVGDQESAQRHLSLRGDQRPSFDDPLVAELGTLMSLTSLEVVRSRVSQNDFDATADLGFTLAKLGDIGGAPEHMEKIVETDTQLKAVPSHEARFRYLLAGLWVSRGQDTRAEPHFRRSAELDPTLTSSRVKLGNLLGRRGLYSQALEQYSSALGRDPDQPNARLKRAAVLNHLGRHTEAVEDLRVAQAAEATRAEAAGALAKTLDRLGRSDEADALLHQTLSSSTQTEDRSSLHQAIADRHKAQGQFETALQEYRQALSLSPDLLVASLEMAAVLGHLGRFGEAAQAYGDVLAQQPESTLARRGQVTALLLAGRYRESIRSLSDALKISGASSPERLDWGHALARLLAACPEAGMRDGVRAVRLANQAFDAQPSLIRAETLAMAHAEQGDFEQASTIQKNLVSEAQRADRPQLVSRLQQRLRLYESRQAFHALDIDDLIVSAPNGSPNGPPGSPPSAGGSK